MPTRILGVKTPQGGGPEGPGLPAASRQGQAVRPRALPGKRGRWSVYLLRCDDGTLYCGATNDLPRRLELHAIGRGARYTRSRLPVTLVYSESVRDRSAALRREAALKRLTRREKLALLARTVHER